MKLFKMEVHSKNKYRIVVDVVAHAETEDQAKSYVGRMFKGPYPRHEIRHCQELVITPAHFVVGKWNTD